VIGELTVIIPVCAGLRGAAGSIGSGIKVQDDALAPEIRQANGFAIIAEDFKIGGNLPYFWNAHSSILSYSSIAVNTIRYAARLLEPHPDSQRAISNNLPILYNHSRPFAIMRLCVIGDTI
jgi:hypothetical protein